MINIPKQKTYKNFTAINKVLSSRTEQPKFKQAFYKHQAMKFWNCAAQSFVDEVKDGSKAMDLKNGVLIVACLSKELAYQIKLLSQRIIERINQLIGARVVYAIFVEV